MPASSSTSLPCRRFRLCCILSSASVDCNSIDGQCQGPGTVEGCPYSPHRSWYAYKCSALSDISLCKAMNCSRIYRIRMARVHGLTLHGALCHKVYRDRHCWSVINYSVTPRTDNCRKDLQHGGRVPVKSGVALGAETNLALSRKAQTVQFPVGNCTAC